MADGESTVVAGNGTIVEAGGVYLVFSGEPCKPYFVAKVISVGGGPGGAAMDCQLGPNLTPVPSPDLWLKMFYGIHAEPPGLPSAGEAFRIIPVSVSMFLAWGPPKFPIRLGTEAVTDEELAVRVEDWYKSAGPNTTDDDGA